MKSPAKILIAMAFAACCCMAMSAQSETAPTLPPAAPDTAATVVTPGYAAPPPHYYVPLSISNTPQPMETPLTPNPAAIYTPTATSLGPLYFSSSVTEMPGLMATATGVVGLTNTFGNFSYRLYAGAIQYATFRSLNTSFHVGGEMTYRFTPNLSVTVFGNYYSNAPYLGMAAYPYVQTTNFGGYLSIDTSSRFGINLGAKTYFDPLQRRYVTDPIVAPYFKVSKGVSIGIDFGHMIKDGIESLIDDRRPGPASGPPMPQQPRLQLQR